MFMSDFFRKSGSRDSSTTILGTGGYSWLRYGGILPPLFELVRSSEIAGLPRLMTLLLKSLACFRDYSNL